MEPVSVMVVDDSADIRTMLRLLLGRDQRFMLIGEAANGQEAIERAASLQPDLIILDRQMPVLGGIEAIPFIRRSSPQSEIVLYTADVEEDTEKAAIAAGAVGFLAKQTIALSLVEDLVDMLVQAWADPSAEMEIRVGPVSSRAARLWVENTSKIVSAIKAHPGINGAPVPDAVMAQFDNLLATWGSVAADTEVFAWVGRARPDEVRSLVEEWDRMDSMGDERMAELGCEWSGPEARVFFVALSEGVLEALSKHEVTSRLGQRLADSGWPGGSPPPVKVF